MTARTLLCIFVAGLALALASPLPEGSEVESFAEATQFVQNYMQEHASEDKSKSESACRKVTDDSINVIKAECAALQKTIDAAAKANQKCCDSGKTAVCAAAKSKTSLDGKTSTCNGEADAIENAKIRVDTSLKALKGGKCGAIHSSTAFKNKERDYTNKIAECNKLSGAAAQAKKALADAISAAATSRKNCNSRHKTQLGKTFDTADKACNSEKNQRAFARAMHMKCVLDGKSLKDCKVGDAPSVTKTGLSKLTCDATTGASCGGGGGGGGGGKVVVKCAQVCASRREEVLLQEQEGLSLPAGFVSNFKIQNHGVGKKGPLIPHPGYTVNIAWRAGSKGSRYVGDMAKWYPAPKYKMTQISSISSGIPAGTHVFYDIIPDRAYNANEIQHMKNFLDTGGRAVLTGEHNGYSQQANMYISNLVTALGGGVQILKDISSTPSFDAKQMNRLAITSGVGKFVTAAWARLAVKRSVADVVMAATRGSHAGKIFCADQILRKGRLTVWADVNPYSGGRNTGDMGFPRNLAHQGAAFMEQVKKGIDPNAHAKEKKKKEESCKC